MVSIWLPFMYGIFFVTFYPILISKMSLKVHLILWIKLQNFEKFEIFQEVMNFTNIYNFEKNSKNKKI